MKKIFYFMSVFALTIGLASCEPKEEPEPTPAGPTLTLTLNDTAVWIGASTDTLPYFAVAVDVDTVLAYGFEGLEDYATQAFAYYSEVDEEFIADFCYYGDMYLLYSSVYEAYGTDTVGIAVVYVNPENRTETIGDFVYCKFAVSAETAGPSEVARPSFGNTGNLSAILKRNTFIRK